MQRFAFEGTFECPSCEERVTYRSNVRRSEIVVDCPECGEEDQTMNVVGEMNTVL